ncbi:MAG: hypothetical protein V1887_01880 [Candidatus Aenigmatarchaeota archaeon]
MDRCRGCGDMGRFYNDPIGELENPSQPPSFYLRLAMEHFDDMELRHINFFIAKMAVKKHFPKDYPSVQPLKSERLSMEQLDRLIKKYPSS